jgi:hypothetical protein
MNRFKLLFAVLLCAATAAVVPAANAQTVHYVGTGSSAMFQGFLVAAANDMPGVLGQPVTNFHHWSVKTSHSGGCGGTCATIVDSRTAGIPPEAANLWIVWAAPSGGAATDIWAYASVDSTVGVRTFLAGAKLVLGAGIGATTPDNIAFSGLLASGAPNNGAAATCPSGGVNTCDDTTLPADVITALGGAGGIGTALTAGMTDIRPEDAKYATLRSLGTTADTNATGVGCVASVCRSWSLGYGPGPVGKPIKSGMGTSIAQATPVDFGLPGFADPITSTTVPSTIQVFPVGEAPIIFVVNRKNTTTGLGQLAADGSYYARNVWDQHPYPPNGMPPQPTTRRPLGNMFTGHDCGTDNAAFQWPSDTGTRITSGPGSNALPIHLFFREPLSGTMNTTEYTEFRIYGTTNGNGATGNGQPALTSQEQNVNPNVAGGNPVKSLPCLTVAGDRTRGIGTGEVVNGVGTSGGVLNQNDSITYTFFSFSNVSKIGSLNNAGVVQKQPGYGYLMIDGIDPLFDNYQNAFGGAGQPATANPGQPAVSGSLLTYGEIPGCATDPTNVNPLPDCKVTGIWGTNPSYPHLRDGKYPAWSELRMMCDTASTNCTIASDPAGAQGLVQNLQADIHFNHLGGVPDFLPFSDAASGALSFNPPYGDASFVREHYAFRLSQTGSLLPTPTSTHESNPQVVFQSEACSGGAAPGTPKTSPPTGECGGDAGGLIVPAGSAAIGILQ